MTTAWRDELERALAGAYAIERELGRGGSATVFLARDRKHDRQVAIKVLLPEVAPAVSAERFLREIQIAAKLVHPHIVPLIDSGRAGALPYYVMPFIAGESLRDRLYRDRTLPVDEAVRLAREVADALDYAHAVGVVHRDIKPENILIAAGHALVADFGIGKAMSAAADDANAAPDDRRQTTEAGLVLGTPAYMSLEQAAGERAIDGRSDIYSLGVVLYEMLTGAVPFAGLSAQAVMAKRFTEDAPPLRAWRADAPAAVERAAARALAREPSHRFATAGEFARALGDTGAEAATGAAAAGASGAVGPSIAVLPFANMSADPDNEFFSDGITEEIINALTRLRRLRVVARTSVFAFKGKAEDVRAIGARLGVRTILEGSVRRAGNRLRITAQLIGVDDGYRLWFEQFDRDSGDIFAVQDEIAQAIAGTLQVSLLGAPARAPAGDAETYELYLRGRHSANRRTESGLHKAIDYYRLALARDERHALAWAGEAEAWALRAVYGAVSPAEAMPRAKEAVARAIELDPARAEPRAVLGFVRAVHDWEWRDAEAELERAIQIDPQYPTARQWLAALIFTPTARHDRAMGTLADAIALDPLSPVLRVSRGASAYYARRYDDAIRAIDEAVEISADAALGIYFRGLALTELGRTAEAVESLERAAAADPASVEMIAALACAHARGGDAARARALLADLRTRQRERYVSGSLLAQVHAALGEREEALREIERAAEERAADLTWIAVRPGLDPLRGEPRFDAVLRRVGVASRR